MRKGVVPVLRAILLIAFAFILLYPLFFMLSNALKTRADVINPSVKWLSRTPSFYSFEIAFRAMEYGKSFYNTFKFEIMSAVISTFSCSVYAYGLTRFKFKLKPFLIFMLVLIIFIPDIVMIIPRITNYRHMDLLGILGLFKKISGVDIRPNLIDTPFAFWLPSVFGVGLKGGLFIFIYMQFFSGLPKELEEAAWIDGAGPVRTFVSVIIPSSSVVILTVFIFSVIWHWNDWMLASMYTTNTRTLASMLYDIEYAVIRWSGANAVQIDSKLEYGIPLAACILFILPPLVMYLFLQKKFIRSIDRVGIVG